MSQPARDIWPQDDRWPDVRVREIEPRAAPHGEADWSWATPSRNPWAPATTPLERQPGARRVPHRAHRGGLIRVVETPETRASVKKPMGVAMRELGVSRSTVKRLRARWADRDKPRMDWDNTDSELARVEGLSPSEAGKVLGISPELIWEMRKAREGQGQA